MDDNQRRGLLTQGGTLLGLVESLINTPEDVLDVNEIAAMKLLIGHSEGADIPMAIQQKAREMLLLVEFIRGMKSVGASNKR